ncbi:uncharacterized protein LOC135639844 isoform X2 [Musa acuminata AAA Group]|uniref:uncharacterized protein LOC135639844 isoform X2 n=1 Tax=Musa acuminata AAA Group TaxID=214697 RepID=UPI0031CF89CE
MRSFGSSKALLRASLMQSLLGETLFELVYIFSSIEPNENTDSLNTRPLPTRTMDTAGTRALNPATTTAFPRRSAVFLPIGEQRKQRRCLHPPSSCRCGVFLGERRLPRLPLHRRNSVSAPPDKDTNIDRLDSVLPVQTLRNFPIEKLYGEVVMVRLDSALLLNLRVSDDLSLNRAILTIKYLYNAGAKVILASNWPQANASRLLSKEAFADHLSALLKVKVVPANDSSAILQFKMKNVENADVLLLDNLTNNKEEVANSYEFSKTLSSGVSIFVNDAFSLSHRVLASTVGVARFCHASVAGFHFEEELLQLMKISETKKQPYVAIIGGSNFLKKANTLHVLASTCDGLIFIGKLAFQIMNGFGLSVPTHLVEHDAVKEALELIKLTQQRKIPIYFQKDFVCVKVGKPELVEIYAYNEILAGWVPVDLGPVSMKETSSMLSTCKKVILIGSVSFGSLEEDNVRTSQLVSVLERISKNGSEVILIGNAACKAFAGKSSYSNQYSVFRNASVAWEFLRGTKLPGVAILDKAFQYNLNWRAIFADPTKPIAVDIGSGNGLFILKVARKCTDLNFLGLEINRKLVQRCLDNLHQSEFKNGYFISTNATSTFRSIVSSYPGDLVLVAIQITFMRYNLLSSILLSSARILILTERTKDGGWYREDLLKQSWICLLQMERCFYSLISRLLQRE